MENSSGLKEIAQSRDLPVPYVAIIRPEAKSKIREHDKSLDIVFDEINKQAIENFTVNNSERFPGVSFSSIKLSVTPDLIKKINHRISASEEIPQDEKPRHFVYFIQPAFGRSPSGNAFSALDIGIDRFIREMPKITGALKEGGNPPTVDIFIVGSPASFGGRITPEWLEKIKQEGFEPHGKLYAEFIEKNLPKDPEELARTAIVLQGASRGVITASKTSKNLPGNIREKTQRLYDIPAGTHDRKLLHQIAKGANTALGFTAEMAVRLVSDPTTWKFMATEGKFYKDMGKKKNIPEDDKEQKELKGKAFLAEAFALLKGNPLDKSERAFVKTPEFDPVNFNLENLRRILLNDLRLFWRKKFLATARGEENKVSVFPISRKAHFFTHKKSFKRWGKIMEYTENS